MEISTRVLTLSEQTSNKLADYVRDRLRDYVASNHEGNGSAAARALGIGQSTLSSWCSGSRGDKMPVDLAMALLQRMGLRMSEVMEALDEPRLAKAYKMLEDEAVVELLNQLHDQGEGGREAHRAALQMAVAMTKK